MRPARPNSVLSRLLRADYPYNLALIKSGYSEANARARLLLAPLRLPGAMIEANVASSSFFRVNGNFIYIFTCFLHFTSPEGSHAYLWPPKIFYSTDVWALGADSK